MKKLKKFLIGFAVLTGALFVWCMTRTPEDWERYAGDLLERVGKLRR